MTLWLWNLIGARQLQNRNINKKKKLKSRRFRTRGKYSHKEIRFKLSMS